MNTKRQRRLAAHKLLKKPEDEFTLIDLTTMSFIPPGMTRAYHNNRFTITVFDDYPTSHGNAIVARVQNHTNTPIVNHWAVLQRIKNTLFGREVTAVEYYPAESELVDAANIYWLVIYPEGILPKLMYRESEYSYSKQQ